MTTTSYGFAGSLGAADFAKMACYVGQYGVLSAGDWAVTAVSGSRAVSIAAGEAFGWNVRAVSDAAQTVALPTPTAGQWFLIVATRNWSAKTTTVNYVAGPTTTTTTPTVAPNALPAATNQNPGTVDDQPLAWAWVNNTSTVVTVVDLRTPVADLQQNRFGLTVEAATSLPGDFVGQRSFALENGTTYRWDGTQWKAWDSDWATYAPNPQQMSFGSYTCVYRYVAGSVHCIVQATLSAAATGTVWVALPTDFAYSGEQVPRGRVIFSDMSANKYELGLDFADQGFVRFTYLTQTNLPKISYLQGSQLAASWGVFASIEYDPA